MFEDKYGHLFTGKKEEVSKLLKCGDFSHGFYRYRCPDCKTELILPFSCKSRLCLSCSRKKLFGWSVNLSQILDPGFSYDHITFTIPGTIQKLLFERGFHEEVLNKLASMLYMKESRYACGKFRIIWRETILKYLRRRKIIKPEEEKAFRKIYKKGFHVYFQPITGSETNILFRTAEYIATGFFHNSQILNVDHEKLKITFQFRSWMEPGSRKKKYPIMTMDLYGFMARILFYIPDSHRKSIR